MVGLFPSLSKDYKKYSSNFDTFTESTPSGKVNSKRNKMIGYMKSILTTEYNPQKPNAKPTTTWPRDKNWIKLILSGIESSCPKSNFLLVWIYSLARFDENQCKIINEFVRYFFYKAQFDSLLSTPTATRKNKSLFQDTWLGDYNITGFEKYPRMTPCLLRKGKVEDINFFTELKRIPTPEAFPEVFSDIAPIVLSTNNTVTLDDIKHMISEAADWKNENPECMLLNAVDRVKPSPVKTKTPTVGQSKVQVEKNDILSLPHADSEQNSGSVEYDENKEYDEATLADILKFDWKHFNFELPDSTYKKSAGSQLEWYTALLQKCKVRDWFLWMTDHQYELEDKSTPKINLVQIFEKLSAWSASTYKMDLCRRLLDKYLQQAQEVTKESTVLPQVESTIHSQVTHKTTTTAEATLASATPVTQPSTLDLLNHLGES